MEQSGNYLSTGADTLVGALVAVARAEQNETADAPVHRAVLRGLCTLSLSGSGCGPQAVDQAIADARAAKERLVPMCSGCASPCGRTAEYPLHLLLAQPEGEGVSLRLALLCALQELARVCLPLWEEGALAEGAPLRLLYLGLYALGYPFDTARLQELIRDCGTQLHLLLAGPARQSSNQ